MPTVLREAAANWRDAWKRLVHKPALFIVVLVGIGAAAEGMARLVDWLQDFVYGAGLGYLGSFLAYEGLNLAATLILYLCFTAIALFVVLSEESFFEGARLNAWRFWSYTVFVWFVALILPAVINLPLSLLASTIGLGLGRWAVAWYLVWYVNVALLQAFLASLVLWRLPGVSKGFERPTDHRPRGMFLTYASLFVVMAVILLGVQYLIGVDFGLIAAFRAAMTVNAVTALLAVLFAFVAFQRAAEINKPAIISVFE